jgi:hypothetical protein
MGLRQELDVTCLVSSGFSRSGTVCGGIGSDWTLTAVINAQLDGESHCRAPL